jgi:hypothetical protein
MNPQPEAIDQSSHDFKATDDTVIIEAKKEDSPVDDAAISKVLDIQPTVAEPDKASEEKHEVVRDSVMSSSSLQVSSPEQEKDEVKRLSITIPGSFT